MNATYTGMGSISGPNNTLSPPNLSQAPPAIVQTTSNTRQQVHDLATKRISTLDYLRKAFVQAQDGHIYWYNTLLFTRTDMTRSPHFDHKKLARRAKSFLFLGLSIPTVLDLNTTNATDYLRALSMLLTEFESYQQLHPAEGPTMSSLSRARLPQMFKRATQTKGRRASSANDIGHPMTSNELSDPSSAVGVMGTVTSTTSSFPAGDQDPMSGQEYTYLYTPFIPFDPDYFESFATLCDALIDCYTRIIELTSSSLNVPPVIGEAFAKADAKLRKVILGAVVKDFDDASRQGARNEFLGLGKVVLGGMM